jgi:hypothetical protein
MAVVIHRLQGMHQSINLSIYQLFRTALVSVSLPCEKYSPTCCIQVQPCCFGFERGAFDARNKQAWLLVLGSHASQTLKCSPTTTEEIKVKCQSAVRSNQQ